MTSPRLHHNILTVGANRFTLVRQELEFLYLIQVEPVATYNMIADAFWGNNLLPPAWEQVIRKIASSIRKKLRPGKWNVRSLPGVGYTLEPSRAPATKQAKRSNNGWKYVRYNETRT